MAKFTTFLKLVAVFVLAALPLALGCGGSKQLPVSGTVKFDGKPLEGAAVGFVPRDQGSIGSGATNAQGEFTIESGNQQGLLPGSYRVTISKKITTGIDFKTERVSPGGIQVKSLIPVIYGDPEKTPLSAEVQSGKIRFDFDLSSKTN
jgi:hypothetical protein